MRRIIPATMRRNVRRLFGIDGCRGGWVIASKTVGSNGVSISVAPNLAELFFARDAMIAIDIPIGLSDNAPRQCDTAARAFLGQPRGSSVFPAPCRCCLGATTYPEACARNFEACGRRISQQCYWILSKISEVDALMSPEIQSFVREVHPELTFKVLSGVPMLDAKRTSPGKAERLAVLAKHGLSLSVDVIQQWRAEYGFANVAVDDIVDAAACLLTCERIAAGKHRIFGDNGQDSRRLRMEIVA